MHVKSHAKKPNNEKDYPWIIFLSVVVVVVGAPLRDYCSAMRAVWTAPFEAFRREHSTSSALRGALHKGLLAGSATCRALRMERFKTGSSSGALPVERSTL